MTYAWLLVGLAIVAEITAALSLRFSEGFTKPLPTVLALVAFGSAFYLISLALVNLQVSIVYPVWAGGGAAGVALLGVLALREKASLEKGLGIVLVVVGIVALNLAAGGHEQESTSPLAQTKGDHAEALESAEARVAEEEPRLKKHRADLQAQLEQAQSAQAETEDDVKSQLEQLSAELATERQALAALKTDHAAALKVLASHLADANAALDGARSEMQAERAEHERALAEAQAAGEASLSQMRSLYDNAAELGGQLTEAGILVSLAGDELQFPSGAATLPEGDLPTLDRVAALLEQRPGLTARVEGHTDGSGSASINQTLSQQRAEAVMQALIARGVAADRIGAKGYGSDRPIAGNATEAGRSANRRVEVYVIE